jgi:response regulator RpfG family c-di-GMP phosphodiesterase
MKTLLHIVTLIALASTAFADLKVKAGPRHGRILELGSANAEFFVEKDRTISIAFYDAVMKAQPASVQVVTATAEAPSGKAKIEFEKKGDLLVAKAPLPAGEGYQVVVQVKATADAKPKNFRIPLILHTCASCQNPEYACTCDE